MTKPNDDLEAVRTVVQALEPFDSKDRDRIIRWSREKLGMGSVTTQGALSGAPAGAAHGSTTKADTAGTAPVAAIVGGTDLRSFVLAKSPKNNNHLAAVVAYYYHFEAPHAERREYISKEDLIDACRKADRERPARPAQVLVNAYGSGLLDKGERGQYRLNSVGENLVAMVLPEGNDSTSRATAPRSRKTKAKKKVGTTKKPTTRTKKPMSKS
ncbi:hypothetical protein [Anaerobaca lacustris]|uniref:Uncharacterized protein n=1 Tax=Anaerobaca lacustris TaxID=3044600 RepID=A0AAW6TYQ6_9BACT|nr:hypothetical protein [Sedimentisphaerales bacterium M17dextr]